MRTLSILFLTTYLLLSQEKIEKISLQLQWLDQFQFAGYYIAKEKGFYKDVNLELSFHPYQYKSSLYSVVSGESTYGIGRSSLLIDCENQHKITLLKSLFQVSPLILMGIKKKEKQTLKDFKNKKIMSFENISSSIAFQSMMSVNQMNLNKDFIQITHSFNVQDLIDKKVSLIASYVSNEPYTLKKLGFEALIFSPTDYGFEFYDDILFTTQKEVKKHPQRVNKFIEASLRGWKWAFNHIEESAQIIYDKYNTQNKTLDALIYEGYALKKLALYHNIPLGRIDLQKLTRIYDIYKSMGFVKKDIDLRSYIYSNPTLSEKLSHFIKKNFDNGNIIKILLLILSLFIAVLYWNRQLKKKVEKEIAIRLENEHLLFRQHRLVAMGEMMNNIAHQWRQPINTINLLILNIQKKYHSNQLSKKYIDEKISTIEKTIEYMTQTINDFSTYLSPNKTKEQFSLNQSIDTAIKLIEPMLKKNHIQVYFQTTKEFQYVGYENEFIQVLIILLNNAKDALLKDTKNSKKSIELSIKQSKEYLEIEVEDNALGIHKKYLYQLFDPYFTTHHKKQGKGLGLYIAKMIIEESFNGKITVKNQHKGARFTMYIQ